MGIMQKKMADKPEPEDVTDQQAEPQGEPASEPAAPASSAPADQAGNADQGKQQGEPVSAEDQNSYTRTVLAGLKVLGDPKSNAQILQTLQQGDQPDAALANVTASIITELDRQSQGKIPEVVLIPAAMEILSELGDVAQKAGVFEVNDQIMTQAAQQLVLKLLTQYGVDPQDVDAVLQNLDQSKVQGMVKQQQGAAQGWAGEASQPDQAQPDQQQPDQPPQQSGGLMQQAGSAA